MNAHYNSIRGIAADIEQLETLYKLMEIKKILCVDFTDFSIVQWNNPKTDLPEEASYVLIKQHDAENGGFVCSEAAFENGDFWQLFPECSNPLSISEVVSWTYYPYDSRLNYCGRIIR